MSSVPDELDTAQRSASSPTGRSRSHGSSTRRGALALGLGLAVLLAALQLAIYQPANLLHSSVAGPHGAQYGDTSATPTSPPQLPCGGGVATGCP